MEFEVVRSKLSRGNCSARYLRVLARSSPEDKFTIANGLNRSMLFEDAAKVAKLKEEGITIFDDRQVPAG